jgi:DNA-binding IclR family transcriptional regulator
VPRIKEIRRRRIEPRRAEELPLDKALAILELLASQPAGLTVFEIAARLDVPAVKVTRSIAILQRRGWLQHLPGCDRLVLGERVAGISGG